MLLHLDPARFTLEVLRQRHPNIDFASLFGAPIAPESFVAQELETIARRPLDHLSAEVIQVLREVVASADAPRRWVALAELSLLDLIRAALRQKDGSAPTKRQLLDIERCLSEEGLGSRR